MMHSPPNRLLFDCHDCCSFGKIDHRQAAIKTRTKRSTQRNFLGVVPPLPLLLLWKFAISVGAITVN